MVQNLKVAYFKTFAPWAVKVYYPCRDKQKKTFLSTSNIISLGQDPTVKIPKKGFLIFFLKTLIFCFLS
jgi:hypothetical protein